MFFLEFGGSSSAHAQESSYFSQLFNEQVLTVSRESDGILPGSLRTVLIQASGIRAQHPFTLVKIVFDPAVKRIRLTKGPLPEISGSLTSMDCQNSQGRVLIEGVPPAAEGADPAVETAGLQLTSNGNSVRNCHFTGFQGPGILIRGNRNVVEYNTVGYHKELPESMVEASAIFEEPKTNQGAGILIADGSSENILQNNEIIANVSNGIELAPDAGAGNKILYNSFAKNGGKPIKSALTPHNTRVPQLTKIQRIGDSYVISGVSEPNADLQIYLLGKEENEIGMVVASVEKVTGNQFTVTTKSKGFIPNHSKLVALAHGLARNTSEFSSSLIIPDKNGDPSHGGSSGEIVTKPVPGETPAEDHSDDAAPSDADSGAQPLRLPEKSSEPETIINIQGMGEPGHDPEIGGLAEKSSKVSDLGI